MQEISRRHPKNNQAVFDSQLAAYIPVSSTVVRDLAPLCRESLVYVMFELLVATHDPRRLIGGGLSLLGSLVCW